jgi:hypothetical protein
MIAKCDCQSCGQPMEFDADQFERSGDTTHRVLGQSVTCPNCGKSTQLYITRHSPPPQKIIAPKTAAPAAPPLQQSKELRVHDHLSFVYQPPKGNDNSHIEIRLSSGVEFKVKAVRLYDRINLSAIESKKAEAAQKIEGFSTGLGAWGSIGWVLATTAVIGVVEGALSAQTAPKGMDLLFDSIRMELDLRNDGAFLPVAAIDNIEHPYPETWLVLGESIYFFGGKNKKIPTAFVHNGDEFIVVQTEDGSVHSIRWSAVESYTYQGEVAK